MLTEKLPTKYKGYHINTDFKCGIKISLALDDWQSGRKRYIEKGGKLGRKVGSVKTE